MKLCICAYNIKLTSEFCIIGLFNCLPVAAEKDFEIRTVITRVAFSHAKYYTEWI